MSAFRKFFSFSSLSFGGTGSFVDASYITINWKVIAGSAIAVLLMMISGRLLKVIPPKPVKGSVLAGVLACLVGAGLVAFTHIHYFPVVDRMISGLEGQIDNILIDNASIARRAVQSLINQGHRQIGLIIGPTDYSTSRERLEGYRQALASSGIPVNDSLIAYSDFTVEGGYESLCHLLKCNPNMTAVFPTNYDMT